MPLLHKFDPVANSVLFSICYRLYLHFLGTSLKKWALDQCHLCTVSNILLNDFEQVYNCLLENYCIRLLKFFVIFGVVFWLCLCSFRFLWLIFFNFVFLLYTLFICMSQYRPNICFATVRVYNDKLIGHEEIFMTLVVSRPYSRQWGHGCIFGMHFSEKRAFCLLAPPKQMLLCCSETIHPLL